MKGYTTRDIASLLGLSVGQIRSYVRSGFLHPDRAPGGAYQFSFHDLVILRAAKGLVEARVPQRQVRRALRKLEHQLPARPITAVRIAAHGDQVVVQDEGTLWMPDSGQVLFDFAVADLATRAAPIAQRNAAEAFEDADLLSAEEWYELGCELEVAAPDEARDAYRRAVELDPHHADAHVNLGRLLHEDGEVDAAESHYRIALGRDSSHPIAVFNLGVALEDRGRSREALAAYETAISADETFADAYFNAAGLLEKLGDRKAALRYLKSYKKLMG